MRFSELNLEPTLISAIEKLKYDTCTPIQEASIEHILQGKDISGLAQTGTGKTAAFLIPLMDRILKAKNQKTERAFVDWKPQNFILVLVPTRELAEQVQENVEKLSVDSGLKGFAIYGGTSYDKQKEAVKNGLEFVVATPGRLIDLYKEHVIDLKQVRAIVFDEADRMFDMGFKEDMKYILGRVPRERQFLVYSATLNFDVLNTAYQFGAEPIEIDVSRDQTKAENVKDEIYHVGQEDKPAYLLSILKKHNPKQAIIFSNFKHSVERIAQFLSLNGIPAMGISSLLTQAQRNRVMEQFKAENEKNILVATDVAARGLDIKGVDMVINYELPNDAESYVHRIGRTGRAGAAGLAMSLVCDKDVDSLKRIEDYLKHKLSIGWMEDQDIVKELKSMPRESFQDRGSPRGDRGFERQGRRPEGGRPARPQRQGEGRRDHPHRGERHEGGGRPEGRPARRERHEGRNEGRNEGRPEGVHRQHEGRSEFKKQDRDQQSRSGNRSNHPHKNHKPEHKHKPKNFQRPAAKPVHGKAKPSRPAKEKSIVSRVSSFFKKLFVD